MCIGPARVIHARHLKEQPTLRFVGAKEEEVGFGDTEDRPNFRFFAVQITQGDVGTLLVLG